MWGLAAGLVGSAALNVLGGNRAADAQATATRDAAAIQDRQYQQNRADMMPWMDAGRNALAEYSGYGRSQINPSTYIPNTQMPTFDPSNLDIYADPSYSFRVQQGENALNRNMAGMGKVMSGNRLGELQKYGQDMASQEYSNMYGRAMDDYKIRALQEDTMYNRGASNYNIAYGQESDYLNRLAGISGAGQNAASGMATMGTNTAANIGNLRMAGGEAQGSRIMGTYNALGNMVNQGAMLYGMGAFNSPSYSTDYSIPMTSRYY